METIDLSLDIALLIVLVSAALFVPEMLIRKAVIGWREILWGKEGK